VCKARRIGRATAGVLVRIIQAGGTGRAPKGSEALSRSVNCNLVKADRIGPNPGIGSQTLLWDAGSGLTGGGPSAPHDGLDATKSGRDLVAYREAVQGFRGGRTHFKPGIRGAFGALFGCFAP